MPIGIVPWTLRHQLFNAEQVEFAYKTLGELGYDGVESFLGGSAGLDKDEDYALMQKYGLRPCSVYCDISKPEEAIATAKKYGVTMLGIPAIPGVMMRRAEGFYAYAKKINEMAEPFRGSGIRLQYHNHAQEFRNFPEENGKTGLEILIENTDPELVCFELDVHWASAAGADPAEWIRKLKGRIPIVHYKDMGIDYETEEFGLGEVPRVFLEVGQGNLNWKAIREACIEAGCEWYNVEQDRTKRPVFESVKLSIDFMRGELGIV
ncbi:MAG: sugar phosphate isomerase/epimerase [Clostridia bacterium]|nr:sugar phosphate isomerase/epimerase [Clostridia bacterium]